MRRFFILVLCCLMLAMPVFAANKVTQLQSSSAVAGDGSCQASCVLTVNLDDAKSDLTFPVPAGASNVTVNGESVRPWKDGSIWQVSLKSLSGFTGSYTLNISYTLSSVVAFRDDGKLELTLPILNGFSMAVESMDFSVTLPGAIEHEPVFYSGYHQESIESNMKYTVSGSSIQGHMIEPLLDSETLLMTLQVPPEMFSATVSTNENSPIFTFAMGVCALLALLYWLIFLRCLPLTRVRRVIPPEGISAGEVSSRLVGSGADLTMMVLSWAQLGYLVISRDDAGRIFLHKRMEMGNERSAFEVRCFRTLFGKKRTVDGTGFHYARLCTKVADETVNIRGQYLRKSGNPYLFRAISAGVGVFAAAAMGASLTQATTWRAILMVLFAVLGGCSAWRIQSGCYSLHLRFRVPGILGLVLCVLWLVLGSFTGLNMLAAIVIFSQILAGFAAAYGGRRTDTARQSAAEILGLRKFLKSASRQELQRILETNPDYYYEMAPYALALGVDKAFARRFGRTKLPGCPYLLVPAETGTALQWYLQLRDAAATLDSRRKPMKYERFLKF